MTCSERIRRPAYLAHRFIHDTGNLAIPTIVLAELYAGAYKHPRPAKRLILIADLLRDVDVLDFDPTCAHEFGRIRGTLLQQGVFRPLGDNKHCLGRTVRLGVRPPRSNEGSQSN